MCDYSKFNPHPDVDDEDVDIMPLCSLIVTIRGKRLRQRRERKISSDKFGKL